MATVSGTLRTLFRRWPVPPRRVVLWHSFAAVPLAAVISLGAFLSYHYHTLSIESRAKVDLGYEVLDALHVLLIRVDDADVAEREFVITGDPASLAPFESAASAVPQQFATLQKLLSESRSRRDERLAPLEDAVAAKFAELRRSIELRRTRGFDAARADAATPLARTSMQNVRDRAAELAAAERAYLARRQSSQRRHEQDVLLVGVAIATLSVATRLAVAWLLARRRKAGAASPFEEG